MAQRPPAFTKKENTQIDSSFTVDTDKTGVMDMPSVTRLLNRKSLGLTSHQPTAGPITRKAQRRVSLGQDLIEWTDPVLASEADPMGKGLLILAKKGMTSALFLALASATKNTNLPNFVGSAAYAAKQKKSLWSGIQWNPALVPSVWNALVKNGHVELGPPGTNTNIKSNRNIVRAAMGIHQEEWLILVRVGPENACRGILALVSEKSLVSSLPEAIGFIYEPVAKAA